MQKNTQKARGSKEAHKSDRADQRPRSNNPDFRELVRLASKIISFYHHRENWQDVPGGVFNNIVRLVQSIHLPYLNKRNEKSDNEAIDKIRSVIEDLGTNHLDSLDNDLEERVLTINTTDAKWAISIAAARMRRKRTNKISEDLIKEYQRDAIAYIKRRIEGSDYDSENETDVEWSPIKATEKTRPISPTTAKPNSPTKQTTAETSNRTPIKTTQQKANSPPPRSPIKPPTRPSDQKANSPPHSPVKPPEIGRAHV